MASRPDVSERHRRQREATYRRILDCARELIDDRPWSEVSIALITEQAGLTRTAFYKHFPDRKDLLLALFAELGDELAAIPDPWQHDAGEGDARALLEQSLRALVETFVQHGRLLQAVAEEAARDRSLLPLYVGLGDRLAAGVGRRIERDIAAGRTTAIDDPAEVATALVWMNERYLRLRFGFKPLGDPEVAARALTDVWVRTLY